MQKSVIVDIDTLLTPGGKLIKNSIDILSCLGARFNPVLLYTGVENPDTVTEKYRKVGALGKDKNGVDYRTYISPTSEPNHLRGDVFFSKKLLAGHWGLEVLEDTMRASRYWRKFLLNNGRVALPQAGDQEQIQDVCLIDMDGVIDALYKRVLSWLPAHVKRPPLTEHLLTDNFHEKDRKFVRRFFRTPDHHEDIPPYPGALEGLQRIKEETGLELHVCSTPFVNVGCNRTVQHKLNRLDKNFPGVFSNRHFIYKKHHIRWCKFILDDRDLRNYFEKADWRAILCRREWNQDVCESYPSLMSWDSQHVDLLIEYLLNELQNKECFN